MARTDIGRKPAHLDLLLSPSRGLQGDDEADDASLRNPDVQGRFRDHVAAKLARWSQAHPAGRGADARKQRMQELGIILLDFRKLREGILSVRRVDAFACEAYEASVLLSVYAGNDPQLSSSLPHLVQALHPATDPPTAASPAPASVSASLDTALSQLSLLPTAPPDPDTRAYFISLFLLHSHLLPAFTAPPAAATPSAASPSHPPLSIFLPTLFSLLSTSSLPAPSSLYPLPSHPNPHITHLLTLYRSLLAPSSPCLARLFSPPHLPPPPARVRTLATALHLPASFDPAGTLLRRAAGRIREAVLWPKVRRAYRFPPEGAAWLARGLLFECEVEGEVLEEEEEARRGEKEARVLTGSTTGRAAEVRGSWEDAADDDAEAAAGDAHAQDERGQRVREEAARRAEVWVRERLAK